jgi:phage FluMu protein Com
MSPFSKDNPPNRVILPKMQTKCNKILYEASFVHYTLRFCRLRRIRFVAIFSNDTRWAMGSQRANKRTPPRLHIVYAGLL